MRCTICPRGCAIDRSIQTGFCGAGALPRVARAALHFWEEPCISGTNGSGTVFFSGCNLRCVFCQNAVLRDGTLGDLMNAEALADKYLYLQSLGAHNINLVTPTPHIPVVARSIRLARDAGLHIPTVWNTNGYESLDSLRSLEGLVDVYLPDLKYVSGDLSERFSGCGGYLAAALPAIMEMQRQVGVLTTDANGLALRGLLIRHLVLPNCLDDSRRVLDLIRAQFPADTHVSLMRQYAPTPAVRELPPLNRTLTSREYDRIVAYCCDLGLTNVYIQGKSAADLCYTPEFTESK